MTTPTLASGAVARAGAGDAGTAVPGAAGAAGAAEPGPFVLNLCSSTTPMALEQAQIPELKRFTFFVSRRREDGRERFRLHMGYFSSLEEAQEWLNVVRDIYPGAWAGETPGKKLRERAAAEAAQPRPAAQVQTTRAVVQPAAPANRTVASAAAQGVLAPPVNVPTLHAAAPLPAAAVPVAKPVNTAPVAPRASAVSSPTAKASPAAARPPVGRSAPPPSATAAPPGRLAAPSTNTRGAPVASAPSRAPAPAKAAAQRLQSPAAPKAPAAPKTAPVTARPAAAAARNIPAPAAARNVPAAAAPRSSVPTAPPAARSPAPQAAAARPAASRPVTRPGSKAVNKSLPSSNVREVLAALDEPTGETRLMPAPVLPSSSGDAALTDTQVLRFLETRRDDSGEKASDDAESGSISLLKPDDTGTRRALKEAVVQNAPVSFAVQLQWSVQPVELEKVPPLAIFSAYTLYTVEGSRDGRKWYGLRLGFFTDAISAKQVAYYVRSEFASVAVVPVSPQERTRASEDEQKTAGLSTQKKTRQQPVDEFKLIDSDEKPALPSGPAPATAAKQAPSAPAAPTANKRGGRVRAREQRSPQTLEETLEILGASQLEIDNGSGETLNESGVRHLRVEIQKNTPFRRLIERLSERVRKP